MSQPKRMADLMDVGLERIRAERRAVGGQPFGRDVDVSRRDDPVGPGGIGECAALVVVKGDLAAGSHFGKGDADDVGPKCQRLAGQVLPVRREQRQIDGNGSALRYVEFVAVPAPIATGEMLGDGLIGRDRRWVDVDVELVGAGICIVEGADIDIISAGRGGGEHQPRIADHAEPDVVIFGQQGAGRVTDRDQRILQRDPVDGDGDLLARDQFNPEPVVIAKDLQLVAGRPADGDGGGG